MSGINGEKGSGQNVGLTQEAIESTVNKALENWNKNKKVTDGDTEEKKPNPEDIATLVQDSISSLIPELSKTITENATKTASETFKSQHYGEIDNLTKQIKILTEAKSENDKAEQEARQKQEQENFNKLKPEDQLTSTFSKQNEIFQNQISQVTQALGSITERLNKNDLSSYKKSIITDADGKVRHDIIPELVQGNSIEELNESLKRAQSVKAQQTTVFAQQLGVKPEQLQDVITNIRKATGADTGGSTPGQKIEVPQNAGQNIDSSSGAVEGEIQVPDNMDDYKKNRKALLNEAAKSSTEMTG